MTLASIEHVTLALDSLQEYQTYPEKIAKIALQVVVQRFESDAGKSVTLLSAQKDLAAKALSILEGTGIVGEAYPDDPALIHFDYTFPASLATEPVADVIHLQPSRTSEVDTVHPLVA